MTHDLALTPPDADPDPAQVIALLEAARKVLHRVEDPREAARIVLQADAIRYLAQKADASAEVQNQAAEVALRSRRKMGELLALVPRGQGTGGGRHPATSPAGRENDSETPYQQILRETGLARDDGRPTTAATSYQQLATIPEDRFEAYVADTLASGRELTTAGAVSVGRVLERRTQRLEKESAEVGASAARAVVFREDAADLLLRTPPASVGVLLTDPPYMTDVPDILAFAARWVVLALSRVREDGRAYIFTGAYPAELDAYMAVISTQKHLQLRQVLPWVYRNTIGPSPLRDYVQNWQAIFYLTGPEAPPLDCEQLTEQFAVQDVAAPDGRINGRLHAWEKPPELAERLIRHSTQPGDIVLDPFAGTGTFVAAAARLGRNGLGCDTDLDMLRLCAARGIEVRETALCVTTLRVI